ncbi:hypothetical protein B0H13DRAFT_1896656 [Mycena leptocephala]|nr:hypothetical protein B0H13DRAFT_1896656 [Mycena leptocephala]
MVVDLEGKLKLAKAEARVIRDLFTTRSPVPQVVFALNASVGTSISNVTALGMTAVLLTPTSSELLAAAATVSQDGSDVAGAQRVSARKRAQADSAGAAPVSSNKRQKKLEDSLAGWVMQDPDTGEKLNIQKNSRDRSAVSADLHIMSSYVNDRETDDSRRSCSFSMPNMASDELTLQADELAHHLTNSRNPT